MERRMDDLPDLTLGLSDCILKSFLGRNKCWSHETLGYELDVLVR